MNSILANRFKKGPATKVAIETPKIVDKLEIIDNFSVEVPVKKSLVICFI